MLVTLVCSRCIRLPRSSYQRGPSLHSAPGQDRAAEQQWERENELLRDYGESLPLLQQLMQFTHSLARLLAEGEGTVFDGDRLALETSERCSCFISALMSNALLCSALLCSAVDKKTSRDYRVRGVQLGKMGKGVAERFT